MGDGDVRASMLRRQVELMGLIAHDAKNPLSAALANLAFVEQVGAGDPEAAEALRDTTDAVKRVRQVLDDVVVASKFEAGVLELHRSPAQLEILVRSAVETWAKDASLRRTTLVAEATTRAASLDVQLVGRALELLVDAALRWGKPGGNVRVRAEALGAGVALVVAHDSCAFGDQPKTKALLVGGSAANPSEIGLSLYYARCVAEAHGGRLAVRAESGELALELP